MKDMNIYEKYLNMEIKEKKKFDFSFKFTSRNQIIGIVLFGIGLIMLCSGFILMFSKKYEDKVVPQDNVVRNVNIKDFDSISSPDGYITIEDTRVTYKKDEDLSEFNLTINSNCDEAELPIKIIFDIDGGEVVIVDYLVDLHKGDSINLFKQNDADLTIADDWRVEVTTKEDLALNYDFTF